MIIELPDTLESALKARANAEGLSASGYVRIMLERDLAPVTEAISLTIPFKTGRGMLAEYGPAPSEEDIDANRAEMFRGFGEDR